MYDPIIDVIKIIVFIVVLAITITLLKKTKNKVPTGQISQESLMGQEKLLIWILCFFNPVLAGAILYYGWKKVLPEKAKMANQISFAALGLVFVLLILFFLFFSNGKDDENVPAVVNSPTPAVINSIDPNLDSDSDGILDVIEKAIGTNPNKANTDGDGFNDLQEIKNGFSPLIAGVAEKYTPEQWQVLKDKIKAVDEKFYESVFGTVAVNSTFTCGISTVNDIDGNVYNTVSIGSQCWLKQNLKVTKNSEGESITKYCYNNDNSICNTDGGLYDWSTAMNNSTQEGAQGICPNGWHIPKDSEWYILENGLKDTDKTCDANRSIKWDCDMAGTKIKSGGSSGFNGILAGTRNTDGNCITRKLLADFWSSTEKGDSAWSRSLFSVYSTINRLTSEKAYGFSVRCIKD